jgi:predicted DNA-binding transcriptional regulator AlpA
MIRLLSKKETAALIGVHPEHLMRLARQGMFCRAIKLGDGAGCAVRFDQAEVDAWIEKHALARSVEPAVRRPSGMMGGPRR